MAQQGLYVPYIRAAVQQSCGKGMAEHMRRDVPLYRRSLNMPCNDLSHPLGRQRSSSPVEQNCPGITDTVLEHVPILCRQHHHLHGDDL